MIVFSSALQIKKGLPLNLDLGTIVSLILSFHDLESYEILQSSLVDGIRNTESVDDRKFLVCDFILK